MNKGGDAVDQNFAQEDKKLLVLKTAFGRIGRKGLLDALSSYPSNISLRLWSQNKDERQEVSQNERQALSQNGPLCLSLTVKTTTVSQSP